MIWILVVLQQQFCYFWWSILMVEDTIIIPPRKQPTYRVHLVTIVIQIDNVSGDWSLIVQVESKSNYHVIEATVTHEYFTEIYMQLTRDHNILHIPAVNDFQLAYIFIMMLLSLKVTLMQHLNQQKHVTKYRTIIILYDNLTQPFYCCYILVYSSIFFQLFYQMFLFQKSL